MTDKTGKISISGPAPGSYAVGYGKPPLHTRFQPGHSGNPDGRPKGQVNLKVALQSRLAETVQIGIDGQPVEMTGADALAMALHIYACKGDMKAAKLILDVLKEWAIQLEK